MRRIAVTLVAILCACAGAGAQCLGKGDWKVTDKAAVITGEYCNVDYGYSIRLRQGRKVFGNTPPAPNHGFGLNPDKPAADDADMGLVPYLWVDASYDAGGTGGLRAATEYQIELSCDRGAEAIVETRRPDKLGDRTAEYVRLRCKGSDTIQEFILAYRKTRSIIYVVQLITTEGRIPEDDRAFREMVANFRFEPLPGPW